MHIYFDTEFTQFRDGELLSIGLVTDDDQSLVIEVVEPGRIGRASDFCQAFVIPQFGCVPASRATTDAEVGQLVAGWLKQFDVPLTLLFDYKLDWHFLEATLRASGQWHQVAGSVNPFNAADVANYDGCLTAQEEYFAGKSNPGRHHPLVDARALRARWHMYLQLSAPQGAA